MVPNADTVNSGLQECRGIHLQMFRINSEVNWGLNSALSGLMLKKIPKNLGIKLSFATKANFSLENFTWKLGLTMQLKEGSKSYTQP